ncbi:hypothetical protein [Actinoplanes sp. CA-252034]|uniref:hypothetical protein n=1 Tax=Actinoplanes sp. CA-252034 TaxID=3239906 RepID=UPI003D97980D
MTDSRDNETWRDEERLPLSELNKAMATWDTDGQNDATDNDAGAEPVVTAGERPSTTGHTGPH